MAHQSIENVVEEHARLKKGTSALGESFIEMLMRHDPRRADVSTTAEGIFQSIEAYAASGLMPKGIDVRLVNAIVMCCHVYNQFELVGKGKKPWPTNRHALSTIRALGFGKPE